MKVEKKNGKWRILVLMLIITAAIGLLSGWKSRPKEKPKAVITVGVSKANIRSGPGVKFAKVTQVHKGQELAVFEMKGEWLRVKPFKKVWYGKKWFEGGWMHIKLFSSTILSELYKQEGFSPPPKKEKRSQKKKKISYSDYQVVTIKELSISPRSFDLRKVSFLGLKGDVWRNRDGERYLVARIARLDGRYQDFNTYSIYLAFDKERWKDKIKVWHQIPSDDEVRVYGTVSGTYEDELTMGIRVVVDAFERMERE